MSRETIEWLNQNTLIGFTDKRGHAWHYKASAQGVESNHYAGAVPVEDVVRRLFNYEVIKGVALNTYVTASGVTTLQDEARFPVGRADTGHTFGYFADGYATHQPKEWLVDTLAGILDGGLAVGSAGNLRNGAQNWVSVEVPENFTTPEGVVFRPNLLAATSHDGSLATTFKRVVTNVVCDNTMYAGLSETGQQFKVKHTRNSGLRIADARDALMLIESTSEEFMAAVKELCERSVTDKQWSAFLDAHVSLTTDKGADKVGKALTLATNERETLTKLWNNDNRVSPWRGTAWGVVQAVNTYVHHEGIVRGMSRADRNVSNALAGKTDALDVATMSTLNRVLISA